MPKNALFSNNMYCMDENHKTDISTFYNEVVCALEKGVAILIALNMRNHQV